MLKALPIFPKLDNTNDVNLVRRQGDWSITAEASNRKYVINNVYLILYAW